MPSAFLAPSLVKLRDEINAEWPSRDKLSDGWIGDTAHQHRVSDHNPDARGMVHAIDVDNDGVDVDLIVNTCIGDSRIAYVIWNRRIWSRIRNFSPIPYTGASPHTEHVHISILHSDSAETTVNDWLDVMPSAEDIAKAIVNYELVNYTDGAPDGKMKLGGMLSNIETSQDRQYTALMKKMDELIATIKESK